MNTTRTGFSLAALAAAILVLFMVMPSAVAQDQDNDNDPPTRAGRIGYTHGSVSFQPGGQGDWLDAVPNRPLTTGDNLWADRGTRAEVQIGSTSVRLGSETSVTFLDLDNNVTQLRLSMGTLYFRVRHIGSDDTFEVDTPNLAFTVTQPGTYRLDVNENGDQTTAVVWQGDAQITGGGDSYRLPAGQQGTFSGTDRLAYDVAEIGGGDDFDRWCRDRDERADRARSREYVSADMTGYEDLDEYGRWHYEGDYGYVWTPVGVPYGWAPYRYGHWVYVGPWGWTWVEDEPWGFAPFHYGRWAFVGGGWCWVPGPVAVAPVYSPALVAFIGGPHFGVAVGVGTVGWFPLAPGEVFVPWYRTSPRYVQNVNITNTRVTNIQVTNVYNNVTVNHVTNVTYVNQRVTSGVTVVNRNTFVNAQPVDRHIVRVDSREIMRAPVTHEVVRDIPPARQSVIGTARPVRVTPPAAVMNRTVVATRQPAVFNRPAAVPGVSRTVAPPPVRTVRPVPVSEARPLERGARGTTPGVGNGPVRPTSAPNNPTPAYNGQPRRGMPENVPPQRQGANVPRPGAPQNAPSPNAPMTAPRGENPPRPGAPQNYPSNARPNAPENSRQNFPANNRPNAPENRPNVPENRPNTQENNRPANGVPRPPSSMPQQQQPASNAPYTRPEQPRPETPRSMPEQPQRPSYNPPQNSTPRNMPEQPRPTYNPPPENRRPQNMPEQPQRPSYNPPPESRSPQSMPEARPNPAPAENRHVNAPPETRTRPAPQMGSPAARPEVTPPPRPESRSAPAPAPRPEARPAESRPQESHGNANSNKGNSDNRGRDNKGPGQFR